MSNVEQHELVLRKKGYLCPTY